MAIVSSKRRIVNLGMSRGIASAPPFFAGLTNKVSGPATDHQGTSKKQPWPVAGVRFSARLRPVFTRFR
jgi:hypothetical protein